jgi:hypothetical protein
LRAGGGRPVKGDAGDQARRSTHAGFQDIAAADSTARAGW